MKDKEEKEEKKTSNSAPGWILWIFVIFMVCLILVRGCSGGKKSSEDSIVQPEADFSAFPTDTLRYNDTLYVHFKETRYILLDTSWSGVVIFPQEGAKQLEVFGGGYKAWAFKDWLKERVAYPGPAMKNVLWLDKNGFFPLYWRFKSVDGFVVLKLGWKS